MATNKSLQNELRTLGVMLLLLIGGYFIFLRPQIIDFKISKVQCIELNQFWQNQAQSDFKFTNEWKLEKFDCPSDEAAMARALLFLLKMNVAIKDKQPEQTYYKWAKSLTPNINKRYSVLLAGKTTYATNTIDINPVVLDKNNWIEIAGIFVHELRHLEEGINTHVPCEKNTSKRCDPHLANELWKGGAYNYNILFFDQIRNMSSVTSDEKKLAKMEMQRIFDQHINKTTPADRQKYKLD